MVGMEAQNLFTFDHGAFDAAALRAVTAMCEGLGRTICIARVLVENGRQVDMAGLDCGVGLLCAKVLDLPPEAGRAFRPQLLALLSAIDELTAAIRRMDIPILPMS